MDPTKPAARDELQNDLREHIESVAPGALGSVSRKALSQSTEEFAATLSLLRDLELAGVLRIGAVVDDSVEFERLT